MQAQNWTTLLSDRVDRSSLSFPEGKCRAVSRHHPFRFGKRKTATSAALSKDRTCWTLFQSHHWLSWFHRFQQAQHTFACVAVNLVDGKEYVFHNGRLPLLCARAWQSSCIYSVRLNGMVLVDGGLQQQLSGGRRSGRWGGHHHRCRFGDQRLEEQ